MRTTLLILALHAAAAAQTCSLTPLTPAEPFRVLEGEPATDSDTFQSILIVLGAGERVYFVDFTSRIRTIDPEGRLRTLAGNGRRGILQLGPALATPMPLVTQVVVSPAGVVHFSSADRIYRMSDGRIEPVAGSGRPGFNGEAAPPLELNLGNVVNFAFDPAGVLYLVDGFLRVRRIDADGQLRTFAGSTNFYDFQGANGAGGPATSAAFQVLRQVIPLRNGTVWIRDLRRLHGVGPDGIIRTLNENFDPSAEILLTPEGNPVAAAVNRVNTLSAEGQLEGPLFAGFTGNPRAIGSAGLYAFNVNATFSGALFLWRDGASTLLAAAPRRAPTSGTSSESFAVWVESTSSLIYRGTLDGVNGLLEARTGQPLRLLAGRGTDTGDPEGKMLSALSLNGIVAFTADNDGRLILLDLSRQRILIAAADGTVTTLKDARQQPVPLNFAGGVLSNSQRLAVDAAGNIYWASPPVNVPGGIPRGVISVWTRSTASVTSYAVEGLDGITRLPNGQVAAITGTSFAERTLRRLEPTRLGEIESGLSGTTFQSATLVGETPYFVAAPRLFRGAPGSIEAFTDLAFPSDTARLFAVAYVLADSRGLILRASDSAFYRLENPNACTRQPQPKIAAGGVLNSAGFGHPDTVSPWQLLTLFGSGLGPGAGQGITLDGYARAAGQPAPYPTPLIGSRALSGVLSGNPMPVIFANDTQMTVQVPFFGDPSDALLFWSWNGLILSYPKPLTLRTATPGIFVQGSGRDGAAAALNQGGSLNSPNRPAAKNSVAQFYLTGLGGVQPPLAGPGAFNSATSLQRTLERVTARIAGLDATVEFAGAAPGFIGGLYQVNVRIPATAPTGAQSVDFEVAGASTTAFQKVTVQVE